jgi:branched-chain amino acid transport system substrate-binding protein
VKYFEAKGYKPEGYTLYTYGAIQAWAQAATKAGTTDFEPVTKELKSGDSFDTVLGSISFDSKGDVAAPGYVFYKWENGTYDYAN